ncbi:cytochrome ubiquinol oxidase subunit I [Naumannella huperziae]
MAELTIARLLFATTASVHYLFVATTLGLTPIIAVLSTLSALRGRRQPTPIIDLLARIYVANYGIGIVAGLVMELQMAMLWTGPGTDEYGPIAGLLALETVVAFFLESTLLGVWLAGRKIIPLWLQSAVFWGITITAYASMIFIVTANSYLHDPIPTPQLTPAAFWALVDRPAAVWPLIHIAASSLIIGAFWCATFGANWLRTDPLSVPGRRLIRIGVGIAALASPPLAVAGFAQFDAARPEGVPTDEPDWLHALVGVMILTGLAIWLLTWFVLGPLTLNGAIFRGKRWLALLRIGLWVPMPVLLIGWIYRELSRQPWFIVGRVTVQEAASPIGTPAMLTLAVVFAVLSAGTLAVAWLVFRRVLRGHPTTVVAS